MNLEQTSIGQEIIKAARWNFVSTILNYSAYFVSIVVLARYLKPNEYGSAAIAISITSFFKLLTEVGFSQAIIATKDISKLLLDTLFTVSIFSAAFFYIFLVLAAPMLAQWYGNPVLSSLLIVAGLGLFFTIFGAIPTAVLQHQLNYRAQAIVTFCHSMISAIAAILLAIMHFGIWALILPSLIASVFAAAAAFVLSRYWPSLKLDFAALRGALNFGLSAFVSNIANFVCKNLVPIAMGRLWTPSVLGFYTFAETKFSRAFDIVASHLVGQIFPVFSKISHDLVRIKHAYLRLIRLGLFILLPLYLILISGAPYLFPFFFGEQWNAAILPFQIFCIIILVRAFGLGANGILYALRLPHISAQIVIFRVIGYILAILISVLKVAQPVYTVALLVAVDSAIIVVYLVVSLRKTEISAREFISFLWVPVAMSAGMYFILVFGQWILKQYASMDLLNFLWLVIGALAVYVLAGYKTLRQEWFMIRDKMP